VRGLVALVEEQHIEFAVVSVKEYVMSGPVSHKNELVAAFTTEFGAPAVLMSQDDQGRLEFFGRLDLAQWLENNIRDPGQLQWREFNLLAA
jgi:hypothetical protein